MTTLLHILASSRGELSHSRRASQRVVESLMAQDPVLVVIERDLGTQPVPHPDAQFVEASLMAVEERNDTQRDALIFSEVLISELEAADVILLSTPMHNFIVPSVLKAWLDHVVRPRRTFGLTGAGKVGLLRDRPTWVIIASGDVLGDDPVGQADFATPYLRHVFKTIGITDLQILTLDGLNRGLENQAAAQIRFDKWLELLVLDRLK